jgi:hypothetical protein
MKKENSYLHYRYWIAFLLIVLILVFSYKWSGLPGLSNALNMALTLSSVILSIIAIFFTVYYNTISTNNTFTFLSLSKDVEKSAKKLIVATEQLNGKLDEIPSRICNIGDKIDTVQESIYQLNMPANKKENETHIEWDILKISNFWGGLSYSAMTTIFLLVKSYHHNNKIKLDELQNGVKTVNTNYFMGISVMLRAVGLIKFEVIENVMVIADCNSILMDSTDSAYDAVVAVVKGIDKEILMNGKNEAIAFLGI